MPLPCPWCACCAVLANNEVGSLQPLQEISQLLKGQAIALHTDASQAVGKIKVDWESLEVDLLTIAGHKVQETGPGLDGWSSLHGSRGSRNGTKERGAGALLGSGGTRNTVPLGSLVSAHSCGCAMWVWWPLRLHWLVQLYAPKGVGALIVRRETPLQKFMHGAGHERGERGGTEATVLIAGLGKVRPPLKAQAAEATGGVRFYRMAPLSWHTQHGWALHSPQSGVADLTSGVAVLRVQACEIARKQLLVGAAHMEAMRDRLLEQIENEKERLRLTNVKMRVNGPYDRTKRLPNTLRSAPTPAFPCTLTGAEPGTLKSAGGSSSPSTRTRAEPGLVPPTPPFLPPRPVGFLLLLQMRPLAVARVLVKRRSGEKSAARGMPDGGECARVPIKGGEWPCAWYPGAAACRSRAWMARGSWGR